MNHEYGIIRVQHVDNLYQSTRRRFSSHKPFVVGTIPRVRVSRMFDDILDF